MFLLLLDITKAWLASLYITLPYILLNGTPLKSWGILKTLKYDFMKRFMWNTSQRCGIRDLKAASLSSGKRIKTGPKDVKITQIQIPRSKIQVGNWKETDFGTIEAETITNLKGSEDNVVVWLHGGAYVLGHYANERTFTVDFARNGSKVIAINYRLAPEYLFPHGLADCISTWLWLKEQGYNAIIGGCSAGGGLAISTALWLRDHGHSNIRVIPVCPSIDFLSVGPSRWLNMKYDYLPWRWIPQDERRLAFYLEKDEQAWDPLVSPILDDGKGNLDIYIQLGEAERLRDDGILYSLKRMAGKVRLDIFQEQVHVWQSLEPRAEITRISLNRLNDWIKNGNGSTWEAFKISPYGKLKEISRIEVEKDLQQAYQDMKDHGKPLELEVSRNLDWSIVQQIAKF